MTNIYNIAITGHRPSGFEFNSKLPGTTYKNVFTSAWSKNFIEKMTEYILLKAAKQGKVRCITGMALGVDQLFAKAAMQAKAKGADVIIHAAIPCYYQESKWSLEAKEAYKEILQACDERYIVHRGSYNSSCMQKRNMYMVDMCDELIAIWDGSAGGTGNCVKYAKDKGCKVNIMPPKSFIQ